MNRLKRELTKRGIIYTASDYDAMKGPEYDTDAELITITDTVIVIGWYSMVMPNRYELYDRFTLEFIASQQMQRDDQSFFGTVKRNPYDVTVAYTPEPYPWEEDEWTEEDEAARAWACGIAPNPDEEDY